MVKRPCIFEVYLYKGLPYIVVDKGTTWLHKHEYVDLVGAGLRGTTLLRVLKEDWKELICVISKKGTFAYHSFILNQEDVKEALKKANTDRYTI